MNFRPIKNVRHTLLACSAISALTMLPGQAFGQDQAAGGDALDVIIVTAQKREQSLQDVPIAQLAFCVGRHCQ